MERERGETYLRLRAEAGLRRAASLPRDSAALAGCTARVMRAAQVLTAVGALDDEVAGQILAGFELALRTRRASSGPGRLAIPVSFPPPAAPVGSSRGGRGPRSSRPPVTPGRVVPVGLRMPVSGQNAAAQYSTGQDANGEICLLSYAQTASCGLLTMIARPGPAGMVSFLPFTATDDAGTRYGMGLHGSGGASFGDWILRLHPDPPPGLRWLDVSTAPGDPATRIDLTPGTRPPDAAWMTVSTEPASPGEHFLTIAAAGLLVAALAHPREVWPYVGGLGPMTVAGGLGEVVEALQACGALPPSSPVPGQLAALCAHLSVTGHGIAAPPARDLPGPWLSVLGQYLRGKARGPDGCAAAAVALPELDGITLTLLGLHNSGGGTALYLHAHGMIRHGGDSSLEPNSWPAIWIRDGARNWHATRVADWSADPGGEVTMRVQVAPPLTPAMARIELLVTGRSEQARAWLPLRWQ